MFHATVRGDLPAIAKLNSASFQDKVRGVKKNEIALKERTLKHFNRKFNLCFIQFQNGFTALIRAIVFLKFHAAELLVTERPVYKSIPDNVGILHTILTQYAILEVNHNCYSVIQMLLLEEKFSAS